jgi:hypothetical protein
MIDMSKEFKVPDVIMDYHRDKKISSSACMLYVYFCSMYHTYGNKEWYYVSSKVICSKFGIKRSTFFNAKKQLKKFKLIEQNKKKEIKLKHLVRLTNEN